MLLWMIAKKSSRGRRAWSKAQASGACPSEVRGFKSHPLHFLLIFKFSINNGFFRAILGIEKEM
jgi:hypothetical protein